jgi:hypothetical protein
LLGESAREKGNKQHIRGGMQSEGGVGVSVSSCCAQRDCTQTHHTGRQGWASTAWLAARVWSQGTHRSVGLTNVCLRKADAQTIQTCPQGWGRTANLTIPHVCIGQERASHVAGANSTWRHYARKR